MSLFFIKKTNKSTLITLSEARKLQAELVERKRSLAESFSKNLISDDSSKSDIKQILTLIKLQNDTENNYIRISAEILNRNASSGMNYYIKKIESLTQEIQRTEDFLHKIDKLSVPTNFPLKEKLEKRVIDAEKELAKLNKKRNILNNTIVLKNPIAENV